MAKIFYVEDDIPKLYAYYDKKTGALLSVTNEKSLELEHAIEISSEEYTRLASGREKFTDYKVGYSKTADNKTVLALVPNSAYKYDFRNVIFEWITQLPTDTTDLLVTWDNNYKQWTFTLSDNAKNRLNQDIVPKNVYFFVMLEDDFDFLIRTIEIDTTLLVDSDTVQVPFVSNIEQKIDKITIASPIVFQSYGLLKNE